MFETRWLHIPLHCVSAGLLALAVLAPAWAEADRPVRGPGHPLADIASSSPCADWVARLPNVRMPLCKAAELRPTVGRSVQGRTLYHRDVIAPDAQIRVLVVGAMHGDELSSASVALHWIQRAMETPANAHWRFLPALNPDGLLRQPARRMNANGVDLNRNFPTPNWARDAKVYWEQRTRKDPRRWPGQSPRLYLDQVGIFPGSLGNYGGVHKGMPVVTIELPSAFRTPLESEMRQMWLDMLRWMSERIRPESPEPPEAQVLPVKVRKPT